MKTPHKHADLIKAWADGARIQNRCEAIWVDVTCPTWNSALNYRIKPEPKPNKVTWHSLSGDGISTCWPSKGSATYPTSIAILRIEIDHNDPANPVLVSATLEKP